MSSDELSPAIINEAFEWHLNTQTPFSQNIFRYASPAWGALLRRAREHYQLGRITELDADDYYLLESDAGELAQYDGREVMLDTPMPIWTEENRFEVYVRSELEIRRVEVDGSVPDFGKE